MVQEQKQIEGMCGRICSGGKIRREREVQRVVSTSGGKVGWECGMWREACQRQILCWVVEGMDVKDTLLWPWFYLVR